MDIKEMDLVKKVNEALNQGKSITEIEKEMQFGKDTLRKKMRKLNYKFDRKIRLYILDKNNIDNTNNTNNIKNNKNGGIFIKSFSGNEIKTLKEIIKIYENKKIEIEDIDYKNSKVVVRSFRSYEKILDKFASFCKQNELNQKEAIAIALSDFIKKSI